MDCSLDSEHILRVSSISSVKTETIQNVTKFFHDAHAAAAAADDDNDKAIAMSRVFSENSRAKKNVLLPYMKDRRHHISINDLLSANAFNSDKLNILSFGKESHDPVALILLPNDKILNLFNSKHLSTTK